MTAAARELQLVPTLLLCLVVGAIWLGWKARRFVAYMIACAVAYAGWAAHRRDLASSRKAEARSNEQ